MITATGGLCAQTEPDPSTMEQLSRLESIYLIIPGDEDVNTRLDNLENKSIGINNDGSIKERLEKIEVEYEKQLKNCFLPPVKPDYSPLIEMPLRDRRNPLNYNYQPQYGNYFQAIEEAIKKQHQNIKEYHFKKFPLNVYIKQANPEWLDKIRLSLKEFEKIIPLKEVDTEQGADIKINVVDGEKMFAMSGSKDRPGLNGVFFKTENNVIVEFKSDVFINKKVFDYPMSIYSSSIINHEFLHALGLVGHSNSIYDILYPRCDVNVLYGSKVGLIRETCTFKDFETFGRLSPRDLNTLWLFYNEW